MYAYIRESFPLGSALVFVRDIAPTLPRAAGTSSMRAGKLAFSSYLARLRASQLLLVRSALLPTFRSFARSQLVCGHRGGQDTHAYVLLDSSV